MEGFHLFWAVAGETNGAAIGTTGGFAINGLADAKRAGRRAVEDAPFRVNLAFCDANDAKRRIIEFFGNGNVIRANKNMREHFHPFALCTPVKGAGPSSVSQPRLQVGRSIFKPSGTLGDSENATIKVQAKWNTWRLGEYDRKRI